MTSGLVVVEFQETDSVVISDNGVELAMAVDKGDFHCFNHLLVLVDLEFELHLLLFQEVLQVDLHYVLLGIEQLNRVVHVLCAFVLGNNDQSSFFLCQVLSQVDEVGVYEAYDVTLLELPNADHFLHLWSSEAVEHEELLDFVLIGRFLEGQERQVILMEILFSEDFLMMLFEPKDLGLELRVHSHALELGGLDFDGIVSQRLVPIVNVNLSGHDENDVVVLVEEMEEVGGDFDFKTPLGPQLVLSLEEVGEEQDLSHSNEVEEERLVEDDEFLVLVSFVEVVVQQVEGLGGYYRKADFLERQLIVVELVEAEESALLAEKELEFLQVH